MKFAKLLFSVFLISMLCGCFGNEPNDMAYICALGIDQMQDNDNLKITIQFARPSEISGGASDEGGKAGEEIIENVSVEAPDILSGVGIANQIVSKRFSLSHTKLIVFSQEIASKGIENIVNDLVRSNDIRPDMYFAVSVKGAGEYLEEVKPVLELNPVKYYQLVYEKNTSSGIPRNTTEDIYFKKSGSDKCAITAVAGSMEEEEHNKEKTNNKGFDYKIKNYIAGSVAIDEKNKSETIGMAVFKNYKLIKIFGSTDTKIYGLLSGQFKEDYTSFYSKNSPEIPITVNMMQRNKPKIKVDLKNKSIDINLFLNAELCTAPQNTDFNAFMTEFEKEAADQINEKAVEFIKRTRDNYDIDIIGIGNKAKMKFLTYEEFDNYDWDNSFKEFKINVDTSFKLKRTGLII